MRKASRLANARASVRPFTVPSPGIRDLKWLKPVYPGDVITYRCTPTEKIDLRSKPGWGMLISKNEGFNQNDDLVFSFVGQLIVEKRGAS